MICIEHDSLYANMRLAVSAIPPLSALTRTASGLPTSAFNGDGKTSTARSLSGMGHPFEMKPEQWYSINEARHHIFNHRLTVTESSGDGKSDLDQVKTTETGLIWCAPTLRQPLASTASTSSTGQAAVQTLSDIPPDSCQRASDGARRLLICNIGQEHPARLDTATLYQAAKDLGSECLIKEAKRGIMQLGDGYGGFGDIFVLDDGSLTT